VYRFSARDTVLISEHVQPVFGSAIGRTVAFGDGELDTSILGEIPIPILAGGALTRETSTT
jgi:hypothetical protein